MATFPDIDSAVEDVYSMERIHGFLCLSAMRTSTTFFAAQQIAASGGAIGVADCPPWVVSELYEWIDTYLKEGHLKWFVPHAGHEVDHSKLADQLARLLPSRAQLGPSLDLKVGEVKYPSGGYKEYFTYYVAGAEGEAIRHGLHRAYTEAGATTETEYRHGKVLRCRQFGEDGREI